MFNSSSACAEILWAIACDINADVLLALGVQFFIEALFQRLCEYVLEKLVVTISHQYLSIYASICTSGTASRRALMMDDVRVRDRCIRYSDLLHKIFIRKLNIPQSVWSLIRKRHKKVLVLCVVRWEIYAACPPISYYGSYLPAKSKEALHACSTLLGSLSSEKPNQCEK